jgi:hypothetical protein
MVFGPFHYCAFCERAAPDAPETIDDQRRGPDVVIGQSTAARAGAHPYRCRQSGSALSVLSLLLVRRDSAFTFSPAVAFPPTSDRLLTAGDPVVSGTITTMVGGGLFKRQTLRAMPLNLQ